MKGLPLIAVLIFLLIGIALLTTAASGQAEVITIKGDYSKRLTSTYEASLTFKDFPEGHYEVRLQYRKKGDREWNNIPVTWSLEALPKEDSTIKVRMLPALYISEGGVYEFRLIGAPNNPTTDNYDNVSDVFEIEFEFLNECKNTCYGRNCGEFEACSVKVSDEGEISSSSCILSSKCGATCDAWVQKYKDNPNIKFSKQDKPCSEFQNCAEVKKDDYNDDIKCEGGKYLCAGKCEPVFGISKEKEACPFSCTDDDVCKLKNGVYKSDFSCPKKKVSSGFEIPQVCCQLGTAEKSEYVIAAVDTILEALESGLEKEAEKFTGFGVISWFNVVEIYKSGSKIKNLDDEIALYTAIRTDLESGRTVEEILNTYRSFLDSKGEINDKGKKFFNEKYGDLVKPGKLLKTYDEECDRQILQKIKENPENKKKTETYECQDPLVKVDILDLRAEEEEIVKNSINPLTLTLEKYDKAVRNNENVDELHAEIFFHIAELTKKKANEGLAVEFYDVAVKNYKGTKRFADAEKELKRLNSKGHKAWVMTGTVGVSILDLDNFIPINPCKGPIKVGCKFVGKAVGLGTKTAVSPLKLAFKLPRLLLLDKDRAIKALTQEGVAPENSEEALGLLKKARENKAAPDEMKKLNQLLLVPNRETGKGVIKQLSLSNREVTLLDDYAKTDPNVVNKFHELLGLNENLALHEKTRIITLRLLACGVDKDLILGLFVKGIDALTEVEADQAFDCAKTMIKKNPNQFLEEMKSESGYGAINNIWNTVNRLSDNGLSWEQISVLIKNSKKIADFVKWVNANKEELAAVFGQ